MTQVAKFHFEFLSHEILKKKLKDVLLFVEAAFSSVIPRSDWIKHLITQMIIILFVFFLQ